MGVFRQEVSHVYRSSPTPFGLRWKHDQLRLIRIGMLLILAMVFMFTVVVEGVAYAHTNQQIQKQDKTVAKKNATKPVTSKKQATKKQVSKKPTAKKSTIKKSTTNKTSKINTNEKSKTQQISQSSNKLSSTSKAKVVASSSTAKKKPAKKPLHATLSKPTSKQIKKTIKGVTIYAYAPVISKKTKKLDVTTSTGATATVGKTIAVDPKIIPLGWWVYVEGLGYRKAEDVGGSIKGKKIDVFVSNNKEARIFGVKKNRTLYVVGPNLPKSAANDKNAVTPSKSNTNKKTASKKKVAVFNAGKLIAKVKPKI